MNRITIGVVATRRDVFSAAEAQRYKDLILDRIKGFDAAVVDIDDMNPEGLLFDERDIPAILAKLRRERVDGLFFPHCNFGSEDLVGKVAAAMGKPVLLWGPRDDAPLADGVRTRDTQCGLFATGKILRRFGVPFTYIENCWADSETFTRGYERFVRVCAVVKAFRSLRVLQLGPRPAGFWSVICNEGELLEQFGVQVTPASLVDVSLRVESLRQSPTAALLDTVDRIRAAADCTEIPAKELETMAALKVVIRELCEETGCSAVAIQCWNALQSALGIMPCAVNGLLAEEGLPVACETDIHGAITSVLLQAAGGGRQPVFFADLTVRHPTNDDAELLWHCGNFPPSLARENTRKLGRHFIFSGHECGTGEWELRRGDITVCRFDGDHGDYRLLAIRGKAVEGPKTRGTYVWFETPGWVEWERKLVEGPYIHHCAGIYDDCADVLREFCKYVPGLRSEP